MFNIILQSLPDTLKNSFAGAYKCASYPDADSLRMCVNPWQGFSQAGTNGTCVEVPNINVTHSTLSLTTLTYDHSTVLTTVVHNIIPNTTITTSRASAISIGSTLFYLVCTLLASFQ